MSRPPTDDRAGRKSVQRNLRQAARLRDNLRRRKAQAQAQSQARAAVSEAGRGEETGGASASTSPGRATDGKSA